MLERVADFIEPTLMMTPPDPWSLAPANLAKLAKLGWGFHQLGRRNGAAAIEIEIGGAIVRVRPGVDPAFLDEVIRLLKAAA